MTTTYDPITVTDAPKLGMFESVPSAAPGRVLVVDRPGHDLRVLDRPQERLTAGEARWGRIRTLFTVDITEHYLEFEDTLPCKGDAGGFRASVSFTCQVKNAEEVVRRGVRDAARVVVPLLTETLRRSCREFPAELSDAAEAAALEALRREEVEGHDPAFRLSRIHVVLRLDAAAEVYVRERKESDRDVVRQQDAARLEREKLELEARVAELRAKFEDERLTRQQSQQALEGQLENQRQEVELARAAARARAEQEAKLALERQQLLFEKERQQMQAELDEQRLTLARKQAELEAERDMVVLTGQLARQELQVKQLTSLLKQGDFARLGLQLAENPQSIEGINAYLARERNFDIDRQLEALKVMVESDGLEGWEITEQARAILHRLTDTWSRHGQLASAPSAMEVLPASATDVSAHSADQTPTGSISEPAGASPTEPSAAGPSARTVMDLDRGVTYSQRTGENDDVEVYAVDREPVDEAPRPHVP